MALFDLLVTYRRRADLEDSTARQYQVVLSLINTFAPGISAAGFFTIGCFEPFAYWLRTSPDRHGKMRTGATVNGRLSSAITLWRHAYETGETPCPPPSARDVKWARIVWEPPTAWSIDELSAILRHVEAAPKVKGWSSDHWIAMLDTLWDCGIRIDSLLACLVTDRKRGMLHLRAEHDKQDCGHWKRLRPETNAELDALTRPSGDRRLFAWPRTVQTLRRHYRRIVAAAGLPAGRRDLFHKIRRSVATHVVVMTGSETAAQKALNHSSLRMTQARYIDPSFLAEHHASDVLPRLPR